MNDQNHEFDTPGLTIRGGERVSCEYLCESVGQNE